MKGRATLKAALAGQAAAWSTVPLLAMPVPRLLWDALNWLGACSFYMSLATGGVVLVWNVLGSREPREPEPPAMALPVPGYAESMAALQRAVLAGTLSVNGVRSTGLRYLGPPPAFTPPRGTPALRYHVPCDACPGGLVLCACASLPPGHAHICEKCARQ